jgi:predicted permease
VKNAVRQLFKTPGFTVVALITLALGIGVNTTAFTVLNRLLMQPLPFPDSSRLVQIWATSPQFQYLDQAPGDYFDERDQNSVFSNFAAFAPNYQSSLAEVGKPAEQAIVMRVTASYFPTMGISPVLGRAFTEEEEAHHASVVILSNAFWQKHFAGDPHVLGGTLRLEGDVVTIVGVMSPLFDDPLIFNGPIALWHLDSTMEVNRNLRDISWYSIVARLKPGATIPQAQAEMTAIATRLAHDFPKSNGQRGFRVAPYPTDNEGDGGKAIIWLIMDLAMAVLLIACVNLANLQLVRTTGRAREYAIRLALGSSRRRLIGMLLGESVLLSIAGGALGLLVAKWGNDYLTATFDLPFKLDSRVLAFAFAASAATGALFGTIPAWLASRANVNDALKQGGRGASSDRSRHRLRHSLIVAELALALTLLTGAGYFVRGIQRIIHRELGWRTDNVLVGSFELPHSGFGEWRDQRSRAFAERFRSDILSLPGVDHAAISVGGSLFGAGSMGFEVEGRPAPPKGREPFATDLFVSPGFFDTYGIHLLSGRDFTAADRPESQKTVIINQAMAQSLWPGENPIGKRIRATSVIEPDWREIVGIVSNTVAAGDFANQSPRFQVYWPFSQNSFRFFTVSLHSGPDARTLKDGVRHALARTEPDVAMSSLQTVDEFMTSTMSGLSAVRRLLLEMAGLGLLLAAVGIYGVIANLASERTQEIGIRMALGAQPRDVLWLFLRNGIRLALLGTAIGLLASFGLTTLLNKMVSFVPGNDPWVVIGLAVLIVIIAIVACWLPARRATRVSPTVALRSE